MRDRNRRGLVAAASCTVLFFCGCTEEVARGLNQAEATRVVVQLELAGLTPTKVHTKSENLWNVQVPLDERTFAFQILDRMRLIPVPELADANRTGLFSNSDDRERENMASQSIALSRSIERIPGVYEAKVHLFQGGRKFGSPGSDPASAAVLVLHLPDFELEVGGIRAIVAGATGINADQIKVVAVAPERGNVAPLKTQKTSAVIPYLQLGVLGMFLGVVCLTLFLRRLKSRRRIVYGKNDG